MEIVKVKNKYQIVIPEEIRKEANEIEHATCKNESESIVDRIKIKGKKLAIQDRKYIKCKNQKAAPPKNDLRCALDNGVFFNSERCPGQHDQ